MAEMKEALRRLARAVTVITSEHRGERFAMVATAISEVSLDPPTMLICVNRTASIYEPLSAGAAFCINVLGSHHRDTARRCSGAVPVAERFDFDDWLDTTLGVPRLADAQASLSCRQVARLAQGTHEIFLGQVEEVTVGEDVAPLIYANGRFIL